MQYRHCLLHTDCLRRMEYWGVLHTSCSPVLDNEYALRYALRTAGTVCAALAAEREKDSVWLLDFTSRTLSMKGDHDAAIRAVERLVALSRDTSRECASSCGR
jgi:hypothetical protein